MRPAIIHATCGGLALALISGFFLSTVVGELSGDPARVLWVKTWIVNLIPLLVLLMAGAGGLGNLAARGRDAPELRRKKARMVVIAMNGIFILIPCALVLKSWAEIDEWGSRFYGVQAIELAAGAFNIYLLIGNLRDGRRLARGS